MRFSIAVASLVALFLLPSFGMAHRHHAAKQLDDAQKFATCPLEGDTEREYLQALNRLKRRLKTPTPADIDPRVTLEAMLAPGDDRNRWNDDHAATIVGYVADVKAGGMETVNCHVPDLLYRDIHIDITLTPLHDNDSRHVIVEVTPQWREKMAAKGVDWRLPTLRQKLLGRWVRVTGWLLFDEEHWNAAKHTAKPDGHVWRATAWELHPVTDMVVLPSKPKTRAEVTRVAPVDG